MEKMKMSLKEAKRLGVMQQVDKKYLNMRQASNEITLSLRQTKRIRKRYHAEESLGLISKHVGKISPNRIDKEIIEILCSEEYAGFGELLQGDGSRHAWFEDRGAECTIVLFVYDATSKITAGQFVHAETTESYQQILKSHLYQFGKPKVLYVDKHSIFRTSRENSGAQERETHFGRVLISQDS